MSWLSDLIDWATRPVFQAPAPAAIVAAAVPAPAVCDEAANFIVLQEVGGAPGYARDCQRPSWPDGDSGGGCRTPRSLRAWRSATLRCPAP